jgi:hypothetical protein
MCSVLIDYCFLWYVAIVCIHLFVINKKRYRVWSVVLGCVIFFEVFFSPGVAGKEKFAYIAWIAPPSFATISSVYSSILGLTDDYFAIHSKVNAADLLMLITGGLLLSVFGKWLWENRLTLKKNRIALNGVVFSLLPILFLLTTSLTLPWASHLPVLYHFVPNVSLFIPRIQISFFIVGMLYLAEYLQSMRKPKWLFFLFLFISIIWGVNSYRFNALVLASNSEESIQTSNMFQQNQSALFFPSWLYMRTINSKTINQINLLPSLITQSKQLEDNLSDTQKICRIASGKTVITTKFITENLNWEVEKIEHQLSTCCIKTESETTLLKWDCRK